MFQVIGSSILIVFDDEKAGVWIIDFAKTRPLPEGVSVTHRDPWVMGNHEEGFLFGLDHLIEVRVWDLFEIHDGTYVITRM